MPKTRSNNGRSQSDWQAAWQLKSRPFMTRTLVVLATFFFVASLGQLAFLTWELAHPPTVSSASLLDERLCAQPGLEKLPPEDCFSLQRSRAILLLESNVMERRYHQANALVMFSVWSRYLGFITGMILAIVGATFILGKLSEPESSLEASGAGWKAGIKSTSPGLILCFLGVVLIVASITTLHSLHTRDTATYLLPTAPGDDGSPIVANEAAEPDDGSPITANGSSPESGSEDQKR